ncbi:hypothetical protein Tco_0634625 [Tanacetum coccineum]
MAGCKRIMACLGGVDVAGSGGGGGAPVGIAGGGSVADIGGAATGIGGAADIDGGVGFLQMRVKLPRMSQNNALSLEDLERFVSWDDCISIGPGNTNLWTEKATSTWTGQEMQTAPPPAAEAQPKEEAAPVGRMRETKKKVIHDLRYELSVGDVVYMCISSVIYISADIKHHPMALFRYT